MYHPTLGAKIAVDATELIVLGPEWRDHPFGPTNMTAQAAEVRRMLTLRPDLKGTAPIEVQDRDPWAFLPKAPNPRELTQEQRRIQEERRLELLAYEARRVNAESTPRARHSRGRRSDELFTKAERYFQPVKARPIQAAVRVVQPAVIEAEPVKIAQCSPASSTPPVLLPVPSVVTVTTESEVAMSPGYCNICHTRLTHHPGVTCWPRCPAG